MNILFLLLSIYSIFFTITLQKNNALFTKNVKTNINTILFVTIPALIVGLYYIGFKNINAGGDTYYYVKSFNNIQSILTATNDASYGTEILFWPTQAFLKIFVDVRGWLIINFIIISILSYYSYKKILENSKISELIFALAFLTYFCVYASNAMRQIYSIPLLFIAFHYLYEKNYLKYIIFSALSIAYHWSAIIILFAPIIILLPNTRAIYLAIPALSVFFSFLLPYLVEAINSILNFNWLLIKSNLYLYGARVSHIDEVWKTLNFWLCVTIYISSIMLKTYEDNQKLLKIILMFFSLMLFSINNVDISERYMPYILFTIPAITAININKFKIRNSIKNTIYLLIFITLAVLVFTRESTISTLGL